MDCSELSAEEKLSLASRISDKLEGTAIALIKGEDIVMDDLSNGGLDSVLVKDAVDDFVSSRKTVARYSVELAGETIIVHSANPASDAAKKSSGGLPPNLKQCPYCAFITPYEELYVVHARAHLFGV